MCNAFIFMEGKNLSTGISENVYKQNHERLWVILESIGGASTPSDLIGKAVHLTEFGETDNIDTGKGVRQGCILAPLLFNIYAENIMRKWEEWEGGMIIGGRRVTNLRYADDTTLFAETKEDLITLVERVMRASEKAGLYMNVGKAKVMTT